MTRLKFARETQSRTFTPEDLEKYIQEAWDWLWKDNLKRRRKGQDFDGNTYYLTASDLEAQVRTFVQEDLEGKKRGEYGRGVYYHPSVRITGLRRVGGLLGAIRGWLRYNDDLEVHNFGKHHISGARYRPKGQPLSPQEQGTLTKKVKEKEKREKGQVLRHFEDPTADGKALCTHKQRATERAKRRGYCGSRQSRKWIPMAGKPEEVTCPRCRKLLEGVDFTLVERAAQAISRVWSGIQSDVVAGFLASQPDQGYRRTSMTRKEAMTATLGYLEAYPDRYHQDQDAVYWYYKQETLVQTMVLCKAFPEHYYGEES